MPKLDAPPLRTETYPALIAIGCLLIMGGIIFSLFYFQPFKLSPEDVWLRKQQLRCDTLHSNLNYDSDAHTVECWRVPFARVPILMFKGEYRP